MKNFFIGLGIVISLSSLAKVGNTISIALGSLEANQLIQSIQEEMGRAVIDNEEIITLKQLKQGTGIPMTATCSGEQSLESIQKQIQDSQQVVTIGSYLNGKYSHLFEKLWNIKKKNQLQLTCMLGGEKSYFYFWELFSFYTGRFLNRNRYKSVKPSSLLKRKLISVVSKNINFVQERERPD